MQSQRRIAQWQRRYLAGLPARGWRRAMELSLGTHSLAMAAQQILCTAPLLVAFSALNQGDRSTSVGAVLSRYLGLSRGASKDVAMLFTTSRSLATTDTLVGLVVALLFATSIAITQQRWYELVWSLPRGPVLRSTVRQLAWVFGLCGYLVIVLYAGRAGHGVGRHVHASRPAGPVAQLGVSFLFFWWSQYLLLGGRVSWRKLVPGAVLMSAGMSILVGLSGIWMSGEIVSEVSDYGLIGSTFVLSVWVVVVSGVLFGGSMVGELMAQEISADDAQEIIADDGAGTDGDEDRAAERSSEGESVAVHEQA